MTQLALATTGMGPRLPPVAPPPEYNTPTTGTPAPPKAIPTTPKKGGNSKKEDTLLMDTKLKIVEILEVRVFFFVMQCVIN